MGVALCLKQLMRLLHFPASVFPLPLILILEMVSLSCIEWQTRLSIHTNLSIPTEDPYQRSGSEFLLSPSFCE